MLLDNQNGASVYILHLPASGIYTVSVHILHLPASGIYTVSVYILHV